MISPNPIQRFLAADRAEEAHCPIPPPRPRLRGHDIAPVASLVAGALGLLVIAAPSL